MKAQQHMAKGWGKGRAYHLGQTARGNDVSSVDESVEVPGRLLDRLAHFIVAVQVEDIGDEVQGILVVLDLGVEPRQVEAVRQVVFVYFAKVLVAARRYELAVPG